MDGVVAALLWALAGAVVAACLTAWRLRRPPAHGPAAPPAVLPAEVSRLLAALPMSGIVLDAVDAVLDCSPPALSHGLVRRREVIHASLLELARRARLEGALQHEQMRLPHGPWAEGRRLVTAWATPLSPEHVLLLVEDESYTQLLEEVGRDFVANVSHELKTPVGGLILLGEALRDASDDPEAVARFAKKMRKEARRLDNLVKDIVQLSRLQSEDSLAAPTRVDLGWVVAEAADHVQVGAEDKNIEVVVLADPGVWVWGDRELLVTAVRNLVVNAVAYSPPDTHIAVRARTLGDGTREVTVTDQGKGISAADQGRIFERFYRVDAARSRATGGTGLGLSIVKHVCANHGGTVSVWSEVGRGSTFTIQLPAPAVGPDALPPADPADSRPAGEDGIPQGFGSPPESAARNAQPTPRKTGAP